MITIRNRSRGFTLIELLVVIAIIGILSAVVLASLSTARSKGNDAAVQSNLSTIQTQAEIFYGSSGNNSYGTTATVCSGAGTLWADQTIANAINSARNSSKGNNVYCTSYASSGSSATAYAIAAQINGTTTTATYWCVDSAGDTGVTLSNSVASGVCH
jgi:prepilin-type N-terminal cleavage/methylation domain-containing protein